MFCFVLNLHISGPVQFKSVLLHGQLCSTYKTLNSLSKKYYNHSLKYIFNLFSHLLFLCAHLNKNHGLKVVSAPKHLVTAGDNYHSIDVFRSSSLASNSPSLLPIIPLDFLFQPLSFSKSSILDQWPSFQIFLNSKDVFKK